MAIKCYQCIFLNLALTFASSIYSPLSLASPLLSWSDTLKHDPSSYKIKYYHAVWVDASQFYQMNALWIDFLNGDELWIFYILTKQNLWRRWFGWRVRAFSTVLKYFKKEFLEKKFKKILMVFIHNSCICEFHSITSNIGQNWCTMHPEPNKLKEHHAFNKQSKIRVVFFPFFHSLKISWIKWTNLRPSFKFIDPLV